MVVDIVVLYFSIAIGLSLSYSSSSELWVFWSTHGPEKLLFTSLGFLWLFALGVFRRQNLFDMKLTLLILIIAQGLSFVSLSILFYVVPDIEIWRSAMLPALSLSLICTFLAHLGFDRFADLELFKRRMLVLGAGKTAQKIQRVLGSEKLSTINCVGFLRTGTDKTVIEESRLLESRSLSELSNEYQVDEIVVALDEQRRQLPSLELLRCRLLGVSVINVSTFLEREEGHVELDTLPSWMIFASGFSAATRIQRSVKRAFDLIISGLFMVFTLPFLIPTAVAIFIEDFGPIFYRQDRVGLHGKVFKLLKFRSMHTSAEEDGIARWASANDPRVTLVGALIRRLRIDELPQIYNVLRGEMSFIGPRPERPDFVRQLSEEIPYYEYRYMVKPGISGWAQINYPYGSSVKDAKEKLKYDLFYIKNYSLILDFIVLIQTLRVIIWPAPARSVTPSGIDQRI
jgi:sugar transferase (PEP-CTERM system associated)